ncbi:MAG: MFS transporter [Chloroflexi bacterium]|nr:MFS transporter [Chloroflexota bacterium]|tara:strand:+ start:180 stop:1484 length:1305 start_codon:yes stop_codon:yes gene_type:complete
MEHQTESIRKALTNRVPFYYGWVVLVISATAMFASGPGQTYSVSIFLEPMRNDLGLGLTHIAGLYTLGSLCAAMTMFFVGRLLDRYGARVMLVSVSICFGLATVWMSNISSPIELLIGFALIRTLGQGSLSLIPTTLVSLWFVRLRGRAMAFHSLGSSFSQAIFPPFIHMLIQSSGWRNAWLSLGVTILGVLLLPALILVRRTPESIGLVPDGKIEKHDSDDNGIASMSDWTLGQAIRTKTMWYLMFAGTSASFIVTALMFLQVSLFESKGLSAELAATVFAVIAPMSLIGAFIGGILVERVTNRYLLIVGQLVLVAAMLWTFLVSNTLEAVIYGGMLGFSTGFLMTVNSVIWPNYYGREHLGSIRGVATTVTIAAAALGPLPFAFLTELMDSYGKAVLVFLVLPALCIVASALAVKPVYQQGDMTKLDLNLEA